MSTAKVPTMHEHDEIVSPAVRDDNNEKAMANDPEVCAIGCVLYI